MYKSPTGGNRRGTFCSIPTVCLRRVVCPLTHLTPFFTCRYQGFQSTRVVWSPTLNPAGTRVKMAQAFFESPDLATIAKDALDGFTLKKDWKMTVVHV
jgi:hypothetical protein